MLYGMCDEVKKMWYVLETRQGEEEKCKIQCEHALDAGSYSHIFIPRYMRMKRYEGTWHTELNVLFSGYLFIDTEYPDAIEKALVPLQRLVRPVCVGKEFVPIYAQEQRFLQEIMNANYIITMSKGNIIDGQYDILEGPLKNKAAAIRRLDRHKRVAEIELSLFGQTRRVKAGLEIVSKS